MGAGRSGVGGRGTRLIQGVILAQLACDLGLQHFELLLNEREKPRPCMPSKSNLAPVLVRTDVQPCFCSRWLHAALTSIYFPCTLLSDTRQRLMASAALLLGVPPDTSRWEGVQLPQDAAGEGAAAGGMLTDANPDQRQLQQLRERERAMTRVTRCLHLLEQLAAGGKVRTAPGAAKHCTARHDLAPVAVCWWQ